MAQRKIEQDVEVSGQLTLPGISSGSLLKRGVSKSVIPAVPGSDYVPPGWEAAWLQDASVKLGVPVYALGSVSFNGVDLSPLMNTSGNGGETRFEGTGELYWRSGSGIDNWWASYTFGGINAPANVAFYHRVVFKLGTTPNATLVAASGLINPTDTPSTYSHAIAVRSSSGQPRYSWLGQDTPLDSTVGVDTAYHEAVAWHIPGSPNGTSYLSIDGESTLSGSDAGMSSTQDFRFGVLSSTGGDGGVQDLYLKRALWVWVLA